MDEIADVLKPIVTVQRDDDGYCCEDRCEMTVDNVLRLGESKVNGSDEWKEKQD